MKHLAPFLLLLSACAGTASQTLVSGTTTAVPGVGTVDDFDVKRTTTTQATTTTQPPTTTTTEPAVVPATAAPPVRYVPSGSVWDDLADCESGNGVPGSGTANWHINTGNGYFGGIQFALRSWQSVGGTGYPHEHSREEQIKRGEMLLARQGWGAWPACSRKMGLR